MSDREWISAQIGLLRQRAGHSIRDVAAYVGCSHSSVVNWEQNYAVPSAVQLVRLARLWNVSLDIFDRHNIDNH